MHGRGILQTEKVHIHSSVCFGPILLMSFVGYGLALDEIGLSATVLHQLLLVQKPASGFCFLFLIVGFFLGRGGNNFKKSSYNGYNTVLWCRKDGGNSKNFIHIIWYVASVRNFFKNYHGLIMHTLTGWNSNLERPPSIAILYFTLTCCGKREITKATTA